MDNKNNMDTENVSSSGPEKRKSSKPIMEKRRRARINASLAELKTFLLDIIKKEGLRHNKMEKADILELTVKHLRQLKRRNVAASGEDGFCKGFSECAFEVRNFLNSVPDLEIDLEARLLEHLSRCTFRENSSRKTPLPISDVDQISSANQTTDNLSQVLTVQTRGLNESSSPITTEKAANIPLQYGNISLSVQSYINAQQQNIPVFSNNVFQSSPCNPFEILQSSINNSVHQYNCAPSVTSNINTGNMISGLQIVPTRLHSGQTALIIPTNIFAHACIPNNSIPVLAPMDTAKVQSSTAERSNVDDLTSSNKSLQSFLLPVQSKTTMAPPTNIETVDSNKTTNIRTGLNVSRTNALTICHSSNENNGVSNRGGRSIINETVHGPVWRPW